MNKEEFKIELEKLSLSVNSTQLNQFHRYFQLLVEWNKVMNLTGIVEEEEVYLKHFYDSLTICKAFDFNEIYTVCDVGSGAGFPGIPLKIMFPNLQITLVDSLQKRVTFLEKVVEELHLEKIEVVHSRIEDYAKDHRESFDIVTARAVASLPILLEYCIPLVKEKGYFLPMKAGIEEELNNSKKALSILDSEVIKIFSFLLPKENSIRNILKIQKQKKTNNKYPRKFSEIKKRPL